MTINEIKEQDESLTITARYDADALHRQSMKSDLQKEFERLNKVLDKLPVGEAAECYRQLRQVILTIKAAKK